MFSMSILSANKVTNSLATISGEVSTLDKDIVDGVMAFFEYGLNSDFSDATVLSGEQAVGIFIEGGVTYYAKLKGLTEDTTYYCQAKGRVVRYDDQDAIDYVGNSKGFMDDLIVNETEFDKIMNSDENLDVLFNSSSDALFYITEYSSPTQKLVDYLYSRTAFIKHSKVIDWFWGKAYPSDEFMRAGIRNDWDGYDYVDADVYLEFNDLGGKRLVLTHGNNGNMGSTFYPWAHTLDLSNCTTLKCMTTFSGNGSNISIKINDDVVFDTTNDHTDSTQSIDVSTYSGETLIELGGESFDDYHGSETRKFDQIELVE